MEPQYTFDTERFRLGKLCKHGHDYEGTGKSIRYKSGSCVACQKASSLANSHKPYSVAARTNWKAKNRELLRTLGLTSDGSVPKRSSGAVPRSPLWMRSIRDAGQLPTVAMLVLAEQKRYWAENPDARKRHRQEWLRHQWQLDYATNPSLRAYHREKSKRRKAKMRGSHSIKVTTAQLRDRFAQFGNACAYCGTGGDLHIEHVVPIARGGTHTLGNVLPACERCNYSKHAHDVSAWYLSQPFFSQSRWRRIGQVMGWGNGSPAQLTLL
jgi:5-methylcytosine-specific restriction endonuclease McrA